MNSLLASIREYALLWAAFAASLIGCAILWHKAMKSSRARHIKRDEEIARLKREREFREEFASPSQETLIAAAPARLIEGLCSNIQAWLEEQPDLLQAFHSIPEPRRWIYALGYLVQDSRESLSEFFRKNGEPLTTAAMEAVQMLIGGEFAEIFNKEFAAYDSNNEEVSLLDKEILLLDARFLSLLQEGEDALYAEVKEYILANAVNFII